MKSSEMWDHGRLGIGRGWNNPQVACLGALFWAHTMQACTYSGVSLNGGLKESSEDAFLRLADSRMTHQFQVVYLFYLFNCSTSDRSFWHIETIGWTGPRSLFFLVGSPNLLFYHPRQ